MNSPPTSTGSKGKGLSEGHSYGFNDPLKNEWLGALSNSAFERLRPLLEYVDLKKGDVLWEAGDPKKYLYFPLTALVGLMHESQSGEVIQIGMTGRLGMIGVVTFMGDARMGVRAIVHRKGRLCRIRGEHVKSEFDQNTAFRDICLLYTETFIASLSVNGICNRLHSVEQQTCKYLLSHQDNADTQFLYATHHEIADILGVQRSSVSAALMDLRKQGLIRYKRGEVVLLDRPGMERSACECYGEIKQQHTQVLADYALKLRERRERKIKVGDLSASRQSVER